MKSSDAIGIFDSGIGGLTVARAVKTLLPNERIIYFGDTAHLPYGDKSSQAIQTYSTKICDFLLDMNCKVIVIACNSASSASFQSLQNSIGKEVHLLDVINPMVDLLCGRFTGQVVGLIGTKQTVTSATYEKMIRQRCKDITLHSLSTPLLVPMIEEGLVNENVSEEILHNYLSHKAFATISALVLGCTHYPLIKRQIMGILEQDGRKVDVLDSAEMVAVSLKKLLTEENLMNPGKVSHDLFYVSDYTESFEKTTKLFFGTKVSLSKRNIWDGRF
ncbi:MAG: glutamate racemase [Bacteroidota bacterium]